MIHFIKIYAVAIVIFFLIDMLWLGVIAKDFYRQQLGTMMKTEFNWIAAFSFYFLFIAALVFFVINPALAQESWRYALFAGAFFGLITYATYDLTNLATLNNWPLKMTIVDMVWGMVLGGSTSTITYLIAKKFFL